MKKDNPRNKPAETINTKWRISAKYDKETYMKKTFGFWKVSFLPANLQNLHLQIINHKLKCNDQLKYFARDENNERVKGDCTFCTLRGIENGRNLQTHLPKMCLKPKCYKSNSSKVQHYYA